MAIELTAEVIETRDGRALVRPLAGGPFAGIEFEAADKESADVGRRVLVELPEVVEARKRKVAQALPLAGLVAGAAAGKLLSQWTAFSDYVVSLGVSVIGRFGEFLGPVMAGTDNMMLIFGAAGLGISLYGTAGWVRLRRRRAMERAVIIKVLDNDG